MSHILVSAFSSCSVKSWQITDWYIPRTIYWRHVWIGVAQRAQLGNEPRAQSSWESCAVRHCTERQ